MIIEHFRYGMFDGKIQLLKTDGVNQVISTKNFQYLRQLGVEDSDKYLWLPTEQVIALPHIEKTEDNNGREWVVNHTLLIRIHDYLRLTNPSQFLSQYFIESTEPPEMLEPIKILDSQFIDELKAPPRTLER